jgi:hypothetical protein
MVAIIVGAPRSLWRTVVQQAQKLVRRGEVLEEEVTAVSNWKAPARLMVQREATLDDGIVFAIGPRSEARGVGAVAFGPGAKAFDGALRYEQFDDMPGFLRLKAVTSIIQTLERQVPTKRDAAATALYANLNRDLQVPQCLLDDSAYLRDPGSVSRRQHDAIVTLLRSMKARPAGAPTPPHRVF